MALTPASPTSVGEGQPGGIAVASSCFRGEGQPGGIAVNVSLSQGESHGRAPLDLVASGEGAVPDDADAAVLVVARGQQS